LVERQPSEERRFGHSGLDITILDYGLSRAEDLAVDFAEPIACDLEKDLSIFTSTHAPQCKVYRQMRSFLLRADRTCLPPEAHDTPYPEGIHGKLSWDAYAPYTNVLWLAYLFEYLTSNFQGDASEVAQFKKTTREMWKYLNPEAKRSVPCFGSAADVVCFAVEAGWLKEEQLMEGGSSILDREDSIILSKDDFDGDSSLRRSPRRR
jgi:serine/threonine-protein kinase haspin